MDYASGSLDAKLNAHLRAVGEDVLRVGQQVKQVRRKTKAAQRSAAESFDKSAHSHDRTAKSYEKLAERGEGPITGVVARGALARPRCARRSSSSSSHQPHRRRTAVLDDGAAAAAGIRRVGTFECRASSALLVSAPVLSATIFSEPNDEMKGNPWVRPLSKPAAFDVSAADARGQLTNRR